MNNVLEFGFLKRRFEGQFTWGEINLHKDYEEGLNYVDIYCNQDGFLYPPQIKSVNLDPVTGEELDSIPNSTRPALLQQSPQSHTVMFKNANIASDKERVTGTFTINLLAYLFGTRLQFTDWWLEGRIPIERAHDFYVTNHRAFEYIEEAFNWWLKHSSEIQKTYTNLLYCFTRATSLEWEWDEFIHQYLVFDGIWNLYCRLNGKGFRGRHKERFERLFSAYNLLPDEDKIDKIYDARHYLFHEAIWCKASIGFAPEDEESFRLPQWLANINSRLLCAITTHKSDYIKSPWWDMSVKGF